MITLDQFLPYLSISYYSKNTILLQNKKDLPPTTHDLKFLTYCQSNFAELF
ncbi:MAG: hypothetical protein US25_C0053G0011 [Candidatus Moranbacteria bacterium GW2011_GWE1_36_7]|nr:MAG: hypothetical protein UR99_C0016G0029 [Candidatus Moranbacteria bacterium GW2011_GWD2_36_12]KKQ06255.1 MAG: hypothetical protein US16_C0020G0001 [Candidatus Moranbacteria bacterium GW2011_GWE2_36_40]KKQ12327.1 MAG: hypothetical protein US25_C0053G0011 [Candidatus Moranbacteria bacterium GW2011_GWE1_36_7]